MTRTSWLHVAILVSVTPAMSGCTKCLWDWALDKENIRTAYQAAELLGDEIVVHFDEGWDLIVLVDDWQDLVAHGQGENVVESIRTLDGPPAWPPVPKDRVQSNSRERGDHIYYVDGVLHLAPDPSSPGVAIYRYEPPSRIFYILAAAVVTPATAAVDVFTVLLARAVLCGDE